MYRLGWFELEQAVDNLAEQLGDSAKECVVLGQRRGGLPLAVMLSHKIGIPLITDPSLVEFPDQRIIWVDDIVDTRRTLDRVQSWLPSSTIFCAWVVHGHEEGLFYAQEIPNDKWIVFPWEDMEKAEADRDAYEASRQ